jgi:ABC-type branched-subunit amino acid transport system ATPase component
MSVSPDARFPLCEYVEMKRASLQSLGDPLEPLLALRNVHAGYGKREVLHGISFDIFSNQIVSLFGDNGAGKSTVLRVIDGRIAPTSGQLSFSRTPIAGQPSHKMQRLGIGYLMQGGRVFPNLTVGENIAFARAQSRDGHGSLPNAEPVFPSLDTYRNVRAGLLSGGMRQLLAITMVLSQQPQLLLLDEPTAGLATDLAEAVMDRLSSFAKQPGRAALLVEQNVDLARRIATHSLTLIDGTVDDCGASAPAPTRLSEIEA